MTEPGQQPERPLRILFSLLHAGYLRHYGEPIRILAERGHRVHVAVSRWEKDAGDDGLLRALAADWPSVTYSVAPSRLYLDGWRRTAWMVRALMDLSRYGDPRYADASALRARIRKKIMLRVATSHADPFSKRMVTRYIDRLGTSGDAEVTRRHIRFFARIEAAIPPSRRVGRLLREVEPDVVLASPVVEIASAQIEILKSAQALGIPTGVCIASWDNLTNKGLIRIQPDRVIVWNDIQRRELSEFHDIPSERAVITGAQKFDKWFALSITTSLDEFCAKVGLERAQPYLLYLCSSYFIAPDEVSFVRRWLKRIRESQSAELREIPVLIRPHPQNGSQWRAVDLREFGDVAIYPREGAQPDANEAMTDFYDALSHSATVVGVNTSALIEAAIVGKSVYTVIDSAFAQTQQGTLHFHYLLEENGGFVHRAKSLDEHTAQLETRLHTQDRSQETAQTRAFVERFCRPQGLERPAAALVADAVVELAHLDVEPVRATVGDLYRRLLIFPIPATISVVAAVITAYRRTRSIIAVKVLRRPALGYVPPIPTDD